MLFKGGACPEGKWGGHGHAMGAPRPGLGGMAGQTDAVATRGMGSWTCMLPTVGYKGPHGSAQRRAWQRIEARMAAH